MVFEIGNLVTLKTGEWYDRKTEITSEDIAEIVDIVPADLYPNQKRYVLAFQDLVDEEGVTPQYFAKASELNLHQL